MSAAETAIHRDDDGRFHDENRGVTAGENVVASDNGGHITKKATCIFATLIENSTESQRRGGAKRRAEEVAAEPSGKRLRDDSDLSGPIIHCEVPRADESSSIGTWRDESESDADLLLWDCVECDSWIW